MKLAGRGPWASGVPDRAGCRAGLGEDPGPVPGSRPALARGAQGSRQLPNCQPSLGPHFRPRRWQSRGPPWLIPCDPAWAVT